MYVILDEKGIRFGRANTPQKAQEKAQTLTEQFSWIDGRSFTYEIAIK